MMKRSLIILSILLFIAIITTACGGNEHLLKRNQGPGKFCGRGKGTAEAPKPGI